jgi:3-deoxy-manno-octulosonate cytidylyltransferase (CMP-KDO synthetase)
MPTKVLGVIPARYASSRFPGKPLAIINGKSMIMRVYEQAMKSSMLDRVIVATDDDRIYNHVKESGGEVIMTSESHGSGTSRIGEVVEKISAGSKCPYEVIVNIQGDEPFIDPLQINLAIGLFSSADVQIGTLVMKIKRNDDIFNPNVVKVVVDNRGKALYFSRSPIPCVRGIGQEDWLTNHSFYRHIGLYAFRTDVLKALAGLSESPAEVAESLEQLRWMYHGYSISTAITDIETIGIDTPEELYKLTNNA